MTDATSPIEDHGEDWHKNRLKGLGGSDANTILSGDKKKILQLWEVKTEKREPEDLRHILPVQIGRATEELNCRWYEFVTGHRVTHRNHEFTNPLEPHRRAEVDGLTNAASDGAQSVMDAKHTAFNSDGIVEKCMPQAHHNMDMVGLRRFVFSVFVGTIKHEILEVEYDPEYAALVRDAEDRFWECVQKDEPPVVILAPRTTVMPVKEMRTVLMEGNNEWASFADDWLNNQDAAAKFEKSKDGLKGLVEDDVGLAHGYGVQIKRSTSNSLLISKYKEPKK